MTHLCSSHAGQLHQRHLHRRVLHRRVRQTQEWQIHHAPQVGVFRASLRSAPTWAFACVGNKMLCVSVMCDRWKDIGTIAHNKSAITVEITSRDDTIIFHMVSVLSGAYTHTHSRIYSHVWRGLRWEVKHCSIWLWLLWDKVSLFSFCRAFICRRIWRWPSTSLAFSPPGTSSTNRTRSVQSESGGHNKHEIFQTRMVFGGGMFTGRLCLGPLTRLHPSEEDPPGPIASLW